MPKKHIIELKDVWKTYQVGLLPLDVLKNINLKIHKGEFVAIVGPSGCGKSTLMNQVGLLDTPTKGKILLENKNISTLTESQLAHIRGKKIGFIFQQFNLIQTLSAIENVVLPTLFQDVPKEKSNARAKELLTILGLGERLDHKPNELSGGQQQRVAIARALINDPEILLADEPTGNLDSTSGNQILDLLVDFHRKQKKTIILITHDMYLVKYAQRVIYLKDGEILKVETVKKTSKNRS
jgi:putative ABC transport system ATP-binding protein